MRPHHETAWLDRAGVGLVALCAALAAMLEALLVPLYIGSVVFPIAILFAILSNFALPRLARALVPSTPAAVVPFVAWLAVMIGFGLVTRPEGDVILPGGTLQWVTYGVLFGGVLAAAVSIVMSTPAPLAAGPAPPAPRPPSGPPPKRSSVRR